MPEPKPEYLDEHHQRIAEFARDFHNEDEEGDAAAFVEHFMSKLGYKQKTSVSWEAPEKPSGQGGGQGQRKPSYFKQK